MEIMSYFKWHLFCQFAQIVLPPIMIFWTRDSCLIRLWRFLLLRRQGDFGLAVWRLDGSDSGQWILP